MQISHYSPLEQVDVAVDLGLVPPPLPDIMTFSEMFQTDIPTPNILIEGILHQGCKMILGGTSKSNKSWSLLDLAMSVASGEKWWGRNTTKSKVLYINFELQPWAIKSRMDSLCRARPECRQLGDQLHFWNLRGRNTDLSIMMPQLKEKLHATNYGMIILDPAYKVLGDRDENANGEVADLMNEFEHLAQDTRAAIVLAHHFAKGDSTGKSALDRMSGAGAWARDPDAILVMTPHETPDAFTVTSILRNVSPIPEFVVALDFPIMRLAPDLNPEALRTPQSKNKLMTDEIFIETYLKDSPTRQSEIVRMGVKKGVSESSINRYLERLSESGVIGKGSMGYWRKHE